INRASVDGLPQVLRPVTPTGSQPPFSVGQSLHPYLDYYRQAFAPSRVLYPLRPSPHLRLGDSVCFCRPDTLSGLPRSPTSPPQRRSGVSVHRWRRAVRRVTVNISRSCSPSLLGLEPLSRLGSALVTMRNPETSLTLPLPVLLRSRSRVRLTFPTSAVCLRPP